MSSSPATSPHVRSTAWWHYIPTIFQGAVVGLVELVPGVSGGTMALVLGIYDRLILSASKFVQTAVALVVKRDRTVARTHFREVEWKLVLPLLLGMVLAVFTLAGPLHHFVETEEVLARSIFLGMVLASLLVPATMVRRVTPPGTGATLGNIAVVLVVALVVFLLLGLPSARIENPQWWALIISGAVAVCALVLPGISGSFVLLTVGLYEPTLEAVSNRDLGYIALFATGAVLGVATLVRALAYLLREHRRITLLIATGLILGSVRALWPWQDGTALIAPEPGTWGVPLLAALAGAGVVLLLWLYERRGLGASPEKQLSDTAP